MKSKLISPSKVSAWLACDHTLTLDHQAAVGALTVESGAMGEMATMLMEKGEAHEAAVLARFKEQGKSVFEVPPRITPHDPSPDGVGERTSDDFPGGWEPFDAWVARVGDPMKSGKWDVVFQMPLVHDGMRGVADFLVRVEDEGNGSTGFVYEAVDAKLTRTEAKPGHVLQLCFYSDAVYALTGRRAETVTLELGSGDLEQIRLADVEPYWRRLRSRLFTAMTEAPTAVTKARPCSHCAFCEFATVCENEWRNADSLVFVNGLRLTDRESLDEAGISTMTALAAATGPLEGGVEIPNVERHISQADLQVRTRNLPEASPPLFEISPTERAAVSDADDLDTKPAGFAALPAPSSGDVFLDFEGHPFWTAEAGLFFLFGLIERTEPSLEKNPKSATAEDDDWQFVEWWAHDSAEERDATAEVVEYLAKRRDRFPDMHVYHYNHTERSQLERLTRRHGVAEVALETLVAEGRFVDVFPIVTGAVQIGVESYGLKEVERLTSFERSHVIDKGAGAVMEYERWMREPEGQRDQAHLDSIGRYNEDDVRATRAVRDWLVNQRPNLEWRENVLEPFERDAELDALVERLHDYEPGTPQHLLGDLLGYWQREDSATFAECRRQLDQSAADLLDDPGAIGGLVPIGIEERLGSRNKPITPVFVFEFPPQQLSHELASASTDVIFACDDQTVRTTKLDAIDTEAGRVAVTWNSKCSEAGVLPSDIAEFKMFGPKAKLTALQDLARDVLDGCVESAPAKFLFGEHPSFSGGSDLTIEGFSPDLESIVDWATQMDRTVVPIQGPPGTGKTYVGSHLVRALVDAGMRVGVCAMSHPAIDNLMRAVVKVFDEADDARLNAVKQSGSDRTFEDRDDFAYGNITATQLDDCNVFAGTAWLFASEKMRGQPVDVLLIDEAGQIGLADTLAAAMGAKNVILLGDPQQLPQVSKASHPNGADRSALQHILEDEPTMPKHRGVFLNTTRRMHPGVNEFISDVMYDGQLEAHQTCSNQMTAVGTGLRWIEAEHDGNSRTSEVEANLIAQHIAEMIGKSWTNADGDSAPLGPEDFIVVAPYNDQRRLISTILDADDRTSGVPVGTVDKFQGQEAAIVFFSMTTSSTAHMPRNADFLFSKNRLNVAISRARCLAHLVCTSELLDATAKTVTEMQQIGALCAFVERSEALAPDGR